MKLTIYNGSPRGKGANSQVIADLIAQHTDNSVSVSQHLIKNVDEHSDILNQESDTYCFVFPLYTDMMPYSVKMFFENMEQQRDTFKDKKLYFFIHSGFPEANQSRILERYLRYFCTLIEAKCMGIVIMGNSESVRYLEKDSKRMIKIEENIKNLSLDISEGRPFNAKSTEYFKGMETLPKPVVFLLKAMPSLFNKVFDAMIKRYGAYDKRFDKPYA